MLGFAVRLAAILLAGWLLVELVHSFKKGGEHTQEEQRTPLPNAKSAQ